MKVNILKEFQTQVKTRKQNNSSNAVITEVNKLLEYDSLRDTQVLDLIAPNSTLGQSKNEMAAVIELEKKEDFYGGEVFTIDQIMQLGAKYRLKFLPSEYYKSYIDPKIALDIRDLERAISISTTKEQAAKRNMTVDEYVAQNGEHKMQMDAHQLRNKFFILAPGKCFKTEKVKSFTVRSLDPIMFYTDDNVHFRVIRKWGKDFTILRRLKAIVTKDVGTYFMAVSFMPALTISLTLSILFSWFFMFIMISQLIALIIFAHSDFHDHFFGKEHVRSTKSFWI